MNADLSIQISGISSKTFASQIIAEIVSEGKTIKTHTIRTAGQISKSDIRKIADLVKKKIDRNLRLGLRYDGRGAVAPLAKSTIEAKKRKGRSQPERVFLDSGLLFGSLRINPIARGYVVGFAKQKYPKTKKLVGEVATYLNEGTDRMPARPFFGLTKKDFEKIVNTVIKIKKVTTTKVTGKDIIQIRNLAGQIISVKKAPAKKRKEDEE